MADRITFNEIAEAPAAPSGRISFDEVLQETPTRPVPPLGGLTDPRLRKAPQQFPQEAVISSGAGNFGASFKSQMVRDPETQLRLVAESLFPNDPNGRKRVGFAPDGRIAFVNDDGQLQYATGRGADLGAGIVANSPEMIAGAIGSVGGSPVAGGALAVAGARGLKQIVAGTLFGEPQTTGGNLQDMATAGATQLVAGGLTRGAVTLANRGRSIDFEPRDLAAAQARQQQIKAESGVDVDLALASGDRRLLGLRNYLAQQPNEASAAIQGADERAAGQFSSLINRVLDRIAKPSPADVSGKAGVNAAQSAIAAAKKEAWEKARPLYEQAYAGMPQVTSPTITRFMSLPYFPQAMASGRRIAALEGRPVGKITTGATETRDPLTNAITRVDTKTERVYSLQDYDYLKQGLDEVISGLKAAGKGKEARALKARRDEFVTALDNASGDAYKAARGVYAEAAKSTIEPLENGIVGVLAKVKDTRAASAAAKLFRDENVTTGEIALARRAISAQDPAAWDGLARQWFAREWTKAQRVTQGGSEVNAAGKFNQAIGGTPELRAKVAAALGPDAARAYDTVLETARILAQAPVRGSNTQPNQAIQQALEGTGGWVARLALQPRQTAIDAARRRAVDDNATRLWDALSDPQKVRQLKIAVGISDRAKRAAYVTSVLATQTAGPTWEAATADSDTAGATSQTRR